MAKAIWEGALLAESNQCVEAEGKQYFPPDAIKTDRFKPSASHTVCPWKGTASYYDVEVAGKRNHDAAWFYPEPKPAAKQIIRLRGVLEMREGREVGLLELGSTGQPEAAGSSSHSSEIQVKAEARRQYRAAVAIVAGIVEVLQVHAGEDTAPQMCVVITLDNIFPAVIQRAVAE